MTLFDRYVVVDWSARNSPATGKDSIWIAELDHRLATTCSNPPTRRQAEVQLSDTLQAKPARRTLLAVDTSLGYPAGSASWFGLEGAPPWRAMWAALEREIDDDDRNRNNRFDVAAGFNRLGDGHPGGSTPFWGRPAANDLDGLTIGKPRSFPVEEFRCCDRLLRSSGRRPASPWQLLGAGSVGSQSLTLIPILERLRSRIGAEVWPFTTGLEAPAPASGEVVIAEVWPTLFDVDLPVHWVRDAAQVHGVARSLAATDRAGALPSWFAPPVDDRRAVESEEGWILGVGVDAAM